MLGALRLRELGAGDLVVIHQGLLALAAAAPLGELPRLRAPGVGIQGDLVRVGVGVVGVGGRLRVAVAFTHDPGLGVALDAVLYSVQVAGEPAVHHGEGRRAAVASLVHEQLVGDSLGLDRLVDAHAVLRHHVPVVERMGHEHGALQRLQLVPVVAPGPELVQVTRDAVHVHAHLLITDIAVTRLPVRRIAAVDEVVEDVDVLAHPAARVANQAVGAVVVVVGRVRCDGDDRLEPLDPGGGCRERERAVVGGARHADLAGGPEGLDELLAVRRGVAEGAPAEPVDHRLGREGLVLAADGRAALGEASAGRRGVHDREASRDPLLDVGAGHDGPPRLVGDRRGGGRGHLLLAQLLARVPEVLAVRRARPRVVGAGLVDHGHLEALGIGLARPRDVDVDTVGLAVPVAVELRLDPQVVLDPVRLEPLDDLGLAVDEDGLDLGGKVRGEGQQEQGGEGALHASKVHGEPAERVC